MKVSGASGRTVLVKGVREPSLEVGDKIPDMCPLLELYFRQVRADDEFGLGDGLYVLCREPRCYLFQQ